LAISAQSKQISKAHKASKKPMLTPAKLPSTFGDGNQTKRQAFGNQRTFFATHVLGDFLEMMNT